MLSQKQYNRAVKIWKHVAWCAFFTFLTIAFGYGREWDWDKAEASNVPGENIFESLGNLKDFSIEMGLLAIFIVSFLAIFYNVAIIVYHGLFMIGNSFGASVAPDKSDKPRTPKTKMSGFGKFLLVTAACSLGIVMVVQGVNVSLNPELANVPIEEIQLPLIAQFFMAIYVVGIHVCWFFREPDQAYIEKLKAETEAKKLGLKLDEEDDSLDEDEEVVREKAEKLQIKINKLLTKVKDLEEEFPEESKALLESIEKEYSDYRPNLVGNVTLAKKFVDSLCRRYNRKIRILKQTKLTLST